MHAVRVAARLRRALNVEVEMVRGRRGEFQVLIEDAPVVDVGRAGAGRRAPSSYDILEMVRSRMTQGRERFPDKLSP
jgi:hypothetical protein